MANHWGKGIFGMNIQEINPQGKPTFRAFVIAVVVFTVLTVWILVAFQAKYLVHGVRTWRIFFWPATFAKRLLRGWSQ